MISTWLKRWAEREALFPILYCDFLTFSISVALEFLTQTRRYMCMYLLCGFWNFKVTLSVEFAAKGKDEMCGKHHILSSLLDFPDNVPSTAPRVNWLLTGFKLQWSLQDSKLPGKWDCNTSLKCSLLILFKRKAFIKSQHLSSFFFNISPPFVIFSENAQSAALNSAKKGMTNEFKKYLFF